MERVWRCILAGGSRHGSWVIQCVSSELSFPPPVQLDGEVYMPMTLTSSNSTVAPMAGSCVMAHSQATLEQVQEAHESMLTVAIAELPATAALSAGAMPPEAGA